MPIAGKTCIFIWNSVVKLVQFDLFFFLRYLSSNQLSVFDFHWCLTNEATHNRLFLCRTFYNNFIVEGVFVHSFILILITHHLLPESFCSNYKFWHIFLGLIFRLLLDWNEWRIKRDIINTIFEHFHSWIVYVAIFRFEDDSFCSLRMSMCMKCWVCHDIEIQLQNDEVI